MSFNISAWSIRQPVPSVLLFVVLLALGWVSFNNLPIAKFPNIDVPIISVTVTQSGAAPAELETQVARKVEDAVSSVSGVKHVTSTLTDGKASTVIEFWLDIDTDRALNDVKDAVTKIRTDLPRAIDEPIISRVNVENQPILTYSASSPTLTLEQLSWHVDDVVKREMQSLKGVGQIDRIGGVTREIRVSLDPDRLLALGVTAADVNRQLRATSVDLAGGKGEVGSQEQSIRTLAGTHTIEDLENTKIVLPGSREVRLKDLASVSNSYAEPVSFARLNGDTPIVAFSIYRAKGASDTEVAARVSQRVAALAAAHPDMSYQLVDDGVRNTYGNFRAAMQTLIEGALLAVVVVFIFLRDWRATVIVALALPLSAIPAFWAMSMMGFSLNLVSLLAITLATGILVDDAIVEIENIVRHMKMGKSAYKASIEAADEIGLAVMAITLTIIAIFAPVSFMGGVAGQYFKQFGLVVVAAVFFSLLAARLITPMLTAYFMRSDGHHEPKEGFVLRAYTRFLEKTLHYRISPYLTVIAGFAIFYGSIQLASLLPEGFMPKPDEGRIVLSAELPPGARLADTRVKTDAMAREILKVPGVAQVQVAGGASPLGVLETRRAAITVTLKPRDERDRPQWTIQDDIMRHLSAIADVRVAAVNDRGDRDVTLSLTGPDGASLAKGVAMMEGAIRRIPGIENVTSNGALDRPEVRITPRLDEMARYGITTEQVSEAVRIATIGDIDANLAKFNAGDRLVPIRVQLTEKSRADLNLIGALNLVTATGGTVPLAAVADVAFAEGPSSIDRYDRKRRVTIGMDLPKMESGTALDLIGKLPEAKSLPPGVAFQAAGDAEIQGEVVSGFMMAMGLGILMVAVVLILLLGSVFHTFTILLSLPLSLAGVVVALLLTNNAMSMPVYIGLLMLMGIVTKNAIMLVDFAVERVKHGMSRHDAIIDAGRKRAGRSS